MKKRFQTRKKSKKKLIAIVSFIIIITIYIAFQSLEKSSIKIDDKTLVKILLQEANLTTERTITTKSIGKLFHLSNFMPERLLFTNNNLITISSKKEPVIKEEPTKLPLIYIYNTHQSEEYATSPMLEYSIKPTVMMTNYILEEILNKNSYPTIVEENSIKEILNSNNWRYSYSYKASRVLIDNAKKENPSLKYFIDVHRDSLPRDKTTVVINDKSYAKILFLVGLENPNYQENLNFTEEINNKIKEKYPQLTKGIYKKSGPGVNGVYNQDVSPFLILIEVGGFENTPEEVMNTALAFIECYMEVIKNYET